MFKNFTICSLTKMLTDHTDWNLIQFLSKLKNRIVRVCELCVHVCVYVCMCVRACECV